MNEMNEKKIPFEIFIALMKYVRWDGLCASARPNFVTFSFLRLWLLWRLFDSCTHCIPFAGCTRSARQRETQCSWMNHNCGFRQWAMKPKTREITSYIFCFLSVWLLFKHQHLWRKTVFGLSYKMHFAMKNGRQSVDRSSRKTVNNHKFNSFPWPHYLQFNYSLSVCVVCICSKQTSNYSLCNEPLSLLQFECFVVKNRAISLFQNVLFVCVCERIYRLSNEIMPNMSDKKHTESEHANYVASMVSNSKRLTV